jgi:hypothetical protein
MTGHYLFEAEFCNRAAGWEKGIVEKNVQDRRRGIWREGRERRWASLVELNAWSSEACQRRLGRDGPPEWPELTVADVWQDEQARLMPCPRAFDGYVEHPVRVSSTALIHFQRNRYSVPCEWVNLVVSLRAYPDTCASWDPMGSGDLVRSFERDQTIYDWMHYISLIERKPGALRNGAPFKTMPAPLQELQRQLLKHAGGDRVMAQVLSGHPAAWSGGCAGGHRARPAERSGERRACLNLLSRLQGRRRGTSEVIHPLVLESRHRPMCCATTGCARSGEDAMSNDIVAAFKALSLHGMASAWPEMLGTARMKALDHETVMHQLLKAEARPAGGALHGLPDARRPVPCTPRSGWVRLRPRPVWTRPWCTNCTR